MRTFINTIRGAILVVGLTLGAVTLHAEEPSAGQTAAVEIIQGQLEAMAAGDKAKAYSYAAPFIQQKFENPETFMTMVARGYGALIAPQAYEFQRYEARDDRAVQSVQVIAQDGTAWMAYYQMQRMEDGSWRIAGCRLEKLPGGAV